jgi:protein-S-isoprenylcysteine O-methyltransferase Ste14
MAIWARHYLGANWSATITIRNSHFLVRTGPYSRMRHPMYSGLLLAIAGTALARGEWRGLLAFAIASSVGQSKRGKKSLGCETNSAFSSKNTTSALDSFCHG